MRSPLFFPYIAASPGCAVMSTGQSLAPFIHCCQPWMCVLWTGRSFSSFRTLLSAPDVLCCRTDWTVPRFFRTLLSAPDVLCCRLDSPSLHPYIVVSPGCAVTLAPSVHCCQPWMCCAVGLNIRITRILANQSVVSLFFLIFFNVFEGQIRYSGHAKGDYVIGILYIYQL
jgi:hypothetical protein